MDRWLIGVGLGLLLAAGSLAYPYIHSRLAGPAPATLSPPIAQEPTAPTAGDHESVAPNPSPTTEPAPPGPLATATPTYGPPLSGMLVPDLQPRERPDPIQSEQHTGHQAPPTRILVPSLGIDAAVVEVTQSKTSVQGKVHSIWNVPPAYAAGWHDTSALVGERGNTVLNGHNTNYGEVFRDIYLLRPGDEVILQTEEISRTYYVSQTLVLPEAGQPLEVRLENARYAMPTEDERLTLITCHPYGSLRNRLIVIARPARDRIESEPPEE